MVELAVLEQDVEAASGEADQGGVVFPAFGSFPIVVGCEREDEERSSRAPILSTGRVFAADGGAGSAGGRSEAGEGGEVAACRERGAATDFEQDPGCGPDSETWR